MGDTTPAMPTPAGTILVPRGIGVDAAVRLAPDPLDPGRTVHTALVNMTTPGPVTPAVLCVVQLPAGPVLRFVRRRGRRLLLRSRAGRFAGSTPATANVLPVLHLMTDLPGTDGAR